MKTYFIVYSGWFPTILTDEEFTKKFVLPLFTISRPLIGEIKDSGIDSLTIDELMKKYVLPNRLFSRPDRAIYSMTIGDAKKLITFHDNPDDVAEDIIHMIKDRLIGGGDNAKLEGKK